MSINEVRERLRSYYVNKTTHLKYDIQAECDFSYKGLTSDETISHIVDFVTLLWQNHPFREGNTRATAVFVIKYLRSCSFIVNIELFADNSRYFRNGNYSNKKCNWHYISTAMRYF